VCPSGRATGSVRNSSAAIGRNRRLVAPTPDPVGGQRASYRQAADSTHRSPKCWTDPGLLLHLTYAAGLIHTAHVELTVERGVR